MAGVRKMPLWQADTITTVGRLPQPGIEGAAERGRLDHALGGAQDDAALVAVAGDEDQARLAAAAAQGARHIGRGGDLERRIAGRIGGQRR